MLTQITEGVMRQPTPTSTYKKRFALFRCHCGNEVELQVRSVKSGNTSSCGCTQYDAHTKHGDNGTRLHSIWKGMRHRCHTEGFANYHDRGIGVSKEWDDYAAFKKWAIAHGYNDTLSIDRIDVCGEYSPANCRWTTQEVQNQNQRLLRSTNTSGYRGVHYMKARNRWVAQVREKGKKVHLGCYNTPEEAATAYDNYIIQNGKYSPLNFAP